MFQDLLDAFRQAVENFKSELNRDQVPEAVDRLVTAMRKELQATNEEVDRLKEEIRTTLQTSEEERKEAATCKRRQELAQKIGDEDTAEVAGEFADKHERRARVLERKALALQEELELRQGELQEMEATVREAEIRRSDLSARAGRTAGRRSMQDADALFQELERMAERVDDLQAQADAARDLSGEEWMGEGASSEPSRRRGTGSASEGRQDDLDRRLEELKRRMKL